MRKSPHLGVWGWGGCYSFSLLVLILAPIEKGSWRKQKKMKSTKTFAQECLINERNSTRDATSRKTAIYSRGSEKKKRRRSGRERQESTKYLKNRSFKRGSRRFSNIHVSILRDLAEPNCVAQLFFIFLTTVGNFRSPSGSSVCSTLNNSFQ